MPVSVKMLRRWWFAFVLVLCAGTAKAGPFEVFVPAYFEPTLQGGALTGPWQTLAQSAAQGMRLSVILNPASGPGPLPPPAVWAEATAAFRCDRCEDLLGFTSTRWGERPIEEVKAEIRAYYEHYPVTGIFLDELPSEADMLDVDANGALIRSPIWAARMAYYSELHAFVRSLGGPARGRVVANPGTRTIEAFLTGEAGYGPGADDLIVFENDAATLLGGGYVPTPWNADPAYRDHLGYLVHSTDAAQLSTVLSRVQGNGARIVYVTDGTDPPGPTDARYTQLPTYWAALSAQAEVCEIPVPGSAALCLLAGLWLPIARRRPGGLVTRLETRV